MKAVITAVLDKKIPAYTRIVACQSTGQAIRGFGEACQNPKVEFNKFPLDFELFHLAEFDEETGKFTNLPSPLFLASASEFVKLQRVEKRVDELADAGRE